MLPPYIAGQLLHRLACSAVTALLPATKCTVAAAGQPPRQVWRLGGTHARLQQLVRHAASDASQGRENLRVSRQQHTPRRRRQQQDTLHQDEHERQRSRSSQHTRWQAPADQNARQIESHSHYTNALMSVLTQHSRSCTTDLRSITSKLPKFDQIPIPCGILEPRSNVQLQRICQQYLSALSQPAATNKLSPEEIAVWIRLLWEVFVKQHQRDDAAAATASQQQQQQHGSSRSSAACGPLLRAAAANLLPRLAAGDCKGLRQVPVRHLPAVAWLAHHYWQPQQQQQQQQQQQFWQLLSQRVAPELPTLPALSLRELLRCCAARPGLQEQATKAAQALMEQRGQRSHLDVAYAFNTLRRLQLQPQLQQMLLAHLSSHAGRSSPDDLVVVLQHCVPDMMATAPPPLTAAEQQHVSHIAATLAAGMQAATTSATSSSSTSSQPLSNSSLQLLPRLTSYSHMLQGPAATALAQAVAHTAERQLPQMLNGSITPLCWLLGGLAVLRTRHEPLLRLCDSVARDMLLADPRALNNQRLALMVLALTRLGVVDSAAGGAVVPGGALLAEAVQLALQRLQPQQQQQQQHQFTHRDLKDLQKLGVAALQHRPVHQQLLEAVLQQVATLAETTLRKLHDHHHQQQLQQQAAAVLDTICSLSSRASKGRGHSPGEAYQQLAALVLRDPAAWHSPAALIGAAGGLARAGLRSPGLWAGFMGWAQQQVQQLTDEQRVQLLVSVSRVPKPYTHELRGKEEEEEEQQQQQQDGEVLGLWRQQEQQREELLQLLLPQLAAAAPQLSSMSLASTAAALQRLHHWPPDVLAALAQAVSQWKEQTMLPLALAMLLSAFKQAQKQAALSYPAAVAVLHALALRQCGQLTVDQLCTCLDCLAELDPGLDVQPLLQRAAHLAEEVQQHGGQPAGDMAQLLAACSRCPSASADVATCQALADTLLGRVSELSDHDLVTLATTLAKVNIDKDALLLQLSDAVMARCNDEQQPLKVGQATSLLLALCKLPTPAPRLVAALLQQLKLHPHMVAADRLAQVAAAAAALSACDSELCALLSERSLQVLHLMPPHHVAQLLATLNAVGHVSSELCAAVQSDAARLSAALSPAEMSGLQAVLASLANRL